MRMPVCSNCGRPLRPALRGFCLRCVTTPAQRGRLARSPDAISNEGPLARALHLFSYVFLALCSIALVVVVWAWTSFTFALVVFVLLAAMGAVGFLGGFG